MGRSGRGRETLGKVRKWSGDPLGGPGGVRGPSGRYKKGRGTLEEVRDWMGRSGTGQGTLGEVRDGSVTLG